MQEDKITKQKLLKYIGKNRFDTEEEFRDFIKPRIKEMLSVPKERVGGQSGDISSDDNRYDIYIYDKETLREIVVLIGLKISRKYPTVSGDDIEKFNSFCMDKKVMYSVLMNETECRFFRYQKTETSVSAVEINEIPPLNHIDYEFSKIVTPEKAVDFLKSRKAFLAAVGVALLAILLIKMMTGVFCAAGGSVKGVIRNGNKEYYTQDSSGYKNIKADQRFCSEENAIDNGFEKVK